MADDNDRAEKRREGGKEEGREGGPRERMKSALAIPDRVRDRGRGRARQDKTPSLPVFRFSTKIRTRRSAPTPRPGLSPALVG